MNATPGPEPPGPGPGTLTGERRAGPYVLELGDAAGTKLSFTTAEDRRQAREIVSALGTKEAEVQEVAAPIDRVDYALEEAEEVTGKVERAAGLLAAIAEGRIDPKSVSEELDALLDLVERLDREGRFKDALRLARALSALLALLGRWGALVTTRRTALPAGLPIRDF